MSFFAVIKSIGLRESHSICRKPVHTTRLESRGLLRRNVDTRVLSFSGRYRWCLVRRSCGTVGLSRRPELSRGHRRGEGRSLRIERDKGCWWRNSIIHRHARVSIGNKLGSLEWTRSEEVLRLGVLKHTGVAVSAIREVSTRYRLGDLGGREFGSVVVPLLRHRRPVLSVPESGKLNVRSLSGSRLTVVSEFASRRHRSEMGGCGRKTELSWGHLSRVEDSQDGRVGGDRRRGRVCS